MDIDIAKIKELAELAKANDLAKIKVTDGDKTVEIETVGEQVVHTVSAAPAYTAAPQAPAAAPPAYDAAAPTADPTSTGHSITAPMVGTFYAASSPDAPPFVKVGDKVTKGQTLCIIEAMKLMNELESDMDGTVVEVCASNAQPVEFGQILFKIA